MVSTFYRKFSVQVLWVVGLSFPLVTYLAETIPSNNDIETWLPKQAEVRVTYDEFRDRFGAEELIFIGLDATTADARLVESLCARLELLPGVRKCWSPDRLRAIMQQLDVPADEIDTRLKGLSTSADGKLVGLAALLSESGLKDRAATVQTVRDQIEYCQLHDDVHLAGAPVVIAEMDRLGGAESNKLFFLVTLSICLCLLYYSLNDWKLALAVLGLTVWAINATTAIIHLAGGEMNFILDALAVMVMVFTLAMSVHFLHYYAASMEGPDPLDEALRLAWKPCVLATLTTTIGLISLGVSDIGPVCQFGYAGSLGSIVALVTGLGLTPAVLSVWPPDKLHIGRNHSILADLGKRILRNNKAIAVGTIGLVLLACLGLLRLESRIEPLDFLPKNSKVLADVQHIQRQLTNTDSIEATVDFGTGEIPFLEKLHRVRDVEQTIRRHPSVRHSMSLATFFPGRLPDSPLKAAQLLSRVQSGEQESDFIADGQRYWRISARIDPDTAAGQQKTIDELQAATVGLPITFTGIAPLLQNAQQEIFRGFKESFAMAFAIITVVMIVSLRSLKAGLVAMIPNLTPICLVFGTLGWIDFPIDIGMMMTGSIALGIAVDGTFHYLLRYQKQFRLSGDSQRSARNALWQTGPPIFQAAVISSVGMLALTLSSFGPTARFGFLMAAMLSVALVGDLVLLPALLYLRPRRDAALERRPDFLRPDAKRRHAPHTVATRQPQAVG